MLKSKSVNSRRSEGTSIGDAVRGDCLRRQVGQAFVLIDFGSTATRSSGSWLDFEPLVVRQGLQHSEFPHR